MTTTEARCVTTISCPAPDGVGGLGAHAAQLVNERRPAQRFDVDAVGRGIAPALAMYTPARFRPGARARFAGRSFDRRVARRLQRGDCLVAFAGQALSTLRRARALGFERIELVSPTAHVDYVAARYADAHRRDPIEHAWLDDRLRRQILREYELADLIHVTSEYTRRSFLAAGVAPEKLVRHRLVTHPRFRPSEMGRADGLFRIVYVGALTVAKGVPVLLDALRELDDPDVRLTLVGGWATRGMRRLVEARSRADSRIVVAAGDPLPHLHAADLSVHASWQDGWGLAPAEALACGLPVVVSADTGMQELVVDGRGRVVPTGDSAALAAAVRRQRARAAAVS